MMSLLFLKKTSTNYLMSCPVFNASRSTGGSCPVVSNSEDGFNFDLVWPAQKVEVPFRGIPSFLTVHEVKAMAAKMAEIQLKPGKTWKDIEFYCEEDLMFPLPDEVQVTAFQPSEGQLKIYMGYRKGEFCW